MGGIFGFYCKSPRRLLDIKAGLQRLAYRGYDGAGVAYLEGGELRVVKAVGGVDALALPDASTAVALGHTRYASRGRKTLENTHPLLDCRGEVAVVLDGIIDDYEAVRERLASAGHRLRSTTDAEVIPHLLESMQPADVAAKTRGVYAFAALAKDGRVFAVQMGQPLVVAVAGDCAFISSDVPSLYGFAEEAYVVPRRRVGRAGPGPLQRH